MSDIRKILVSPFIAMIRLYQRKISVNFPRRCKYYPTCSAYTIESLKIHGLLKGMLLASWRLLRCNPWSKGEWIASHDMGNGRKNRLAIPN
ncbi:membrane protein insertion efficiency factor YidD [Arcanobacterium hippocoleae]|uniref:membrane protein insertion efficiency factor YidD n=1 Tax=Arcanobacterium hippocoleae TaxID=149017 RepID=UPI0033421853